MNVTTLRYDTLGSTNAEALDQAHQGADEGLCIVAGTQTAGRGRHGRAWVSNSDAGLYFSIVLRPKLNTRDLPLITLMAGVAVHDTLAEFGLNPDIKWVNDVLVNDKKISGILAETTEAKRGLAVIVGIGINVKSSNFPPEIAEIATSVEAETKRNVTLTDLEETLVRFLNYFYELLQSEGGPKIIMNEWQQRSSYFSGKHVNLYLENDTITGITDGLEPNGALRIKTNNGNTIVVQAGDVQRVRTDSD
jgi:BirA family transcriptional regulator, biotin operon repressor / biotin---[acetyl-CoA-carboxylase] ligase